MSSYWGYTETTHRFRPHASTYGETYVKWHEGDDHVTVRWFDEKMKVNAADIPLLIDLLTAAHATSRRPK